MLLLNYCFKVLKIKNYNHQFSNLGIKETFYIYLLKLKLGAKI